MYIECGWYRIYGVGISLVVDLGSTAGSQSCR